MKNHLIKHPINKVCQLLDVSPSGYYAWLKRKPNSSSLINSVKTHYWRHKARLGASSLVHDVRDDGHNVSERTISRLLQTLGLRSKASRKFKHKKDISTRHNVAPNTLNRQFNPDKPNNIW